MAPPLIDLQNIVLGFGGAPLLDGADLSVGAGDRLALVARNGAGKSTLLKIAAGLIGHDEGSRFVQPGITIRYLPQEPDLSGHATVLEYVLDGFEGESDPVRASLLLQELGLDPEQGTAHLSGGETRRAALARTLAPRPDLLLLDEPTNHLDIVAIQWLEKELNRLRSALVLISHDRAFLQATTRSIIWLDRGRTRRLDQPFSRFEQWRDRILEEEEQALHKLDRKINAEEHWLRYGVTARRKRNVRRLRELGELRKARAEHVHARGNVEISVARGGRSGTIVLDADRISKNLGGRQLVSDFSLRMLKGDRLAIVGPNGAGKTTLVNLLTGRLPPDSGEVKLGAGVQLGMLEQDRATLDPATSLKDALTGGGKDTVLINGAERHVIGFMKDFLFSPDQIHTPLSALSGGERARVLLARTLSLPSNLLVLDEPTNDLDMETLDLMQETIAAYAGTVILVSHDRDFIDRVATLTVVAGDAGTWQVHAGGYADMVRQRGYGVGEKPPVAGSNPSSPKPGKQPPTGTDGKEKPARSRASGRRRKLSFNQQHALKELPREIDALEKDMNRMEQRLADPDLFSRDPDLFHRLSRQLEDARARYSEMESRWLELEILREEIEAE